MYKGRSNPRGAMVSSLCFCIGIIQIARRGYLIQHRLANDLAIPTHPKGKRLAGCQTITDKCIDATIACIDATDRARGNALLSYKATSLPGALVRLFERSATTSGVCYTPL